MDINISKEGKISREQAWLTAWLKIACCIDCKESKVATNWANECLKDYDKRFPEKKEEVQP